MAHTNEAREGWTGDNRSLILHTPPIRESEGGSFSIQAFALCASKLDHVSRVDPARSLLWISRELIFRLSISIVGSGVGLWKVGNG